MSILNSYKPKRSGRRYSAKSPDLTKPITQGKAKAPVKTKSKPYSKNSRLRYFGVFTAPDGTEYLIRKRAPVKPDDSGPKNDDKFANRFGRRVLIVPDNRGRIPADLLGMVEHRERDGFIRTAWTGGAVGVVCESVWSIIWNGTRKGKAPRARWSITALWNHRDCDTLEVRMHPDTPHYNQIRDALAERGIVCRYW